MNVIFIYFFINILITVIIFAIEYDMIVEAFMYVIGLPFFLVFSIIYKFLTKWIFNIKAFIIFGRGCKPITSSQFKIIGKGNKNIEFYKRLFSIPSIEDKVRYMDIVEDMKDINGS